MHFIKWFLLIFVILNNQCRFVFCLDFGYTINETLNDFKNKGISDVCADDILRLNINLKNVTLWAMEMWESTAKGVSGHLHGTNYQLGNFDECLTPTRNSDPDDPFGIKRQYCLAKVTFENPYPKNYMATVRLFNKEGSALDKMLSNGDLSKIERDVLYSAMCVPASCSVSDLNLFLNTTDEMFKIFDMYNLTYSVMLDDESCQQDKTHVPYTTGSLVMIYILSVLTCLAIVSTVVQWYKEHTGKSSCNLIKCFSIIQHVNQLTKINDKDKELSFMYGIRVIAIFFIVVDHRFGTTMQGPLVNREDMEALYVTWEANLIYQSEISVDIFFVLSGLLTIYQLMKNSEKRRLNYIEILFLRYIRLMALYIFVIFLTATLLSQSGTGPLWNVVMEKEAEHCLESWWTNILMINNYINVDRMCMIHSWYIPCDFHYFIIALVLCAVMKNRTRIKLGLIVLCVLLFVSVLIPILLTYYMKLPGILEFKNDFLRQPRVNIFFQHMYITSHTRFSAYALGLFTGFIVYKFYKPGERKVSMEKSVLTVIVLVVIFSILTIILTYFVGVESEYEALRVALYAGLHRPIRCSILSIFLLICIFGEIPFIQSFLSWNLWVVLGKLTYAVYLIHMGLQLRMAASIRTPVFSTAYRILQLSIADVVLAFIFSFIGYLLVEGPINFLLKNMFSPPVIRKFEETYTEKGRTNEGLELEQTVGYQNSGNIHTVS